jgi:septal ring factor EnvC (AmiA/AmiB activator)
MPKVEDIKVLNIDNVPYAVDAMSDEVKQLVEVYNEWNQDLADSQKDFAQKRAAVQSLSNQIITQVRQEKAQEEAAAAEAAAAETEAETPEPVVTEVPPLQEAAPANDEG